MSTSSRGRARIGVLVPFTNTNLEPDLTMLRPEGVSFSYTRLGGYEIDAVPDADQMAGMGEMPLDEPLRLLAGARPDVILYGCTSATLTLGSAFDKQLTRHIRDMTGATTVTAAGAIVHALQSLDVNRIGFASPYVAEINDRAISFLSDSGIETVSRADVDVALSSHGQGEMTPDEVFSLGKQADSSDAQAVVLSCTDMRGVETIKRLEETLGKPVVSSNQAMLFAALQELNINTGDIDCGRLFMHSV